MPEPIVVLHVDDEPDFAEVTADFLEREDDRIEVVTETHVSDGLDRLATEEFDCVISDYDMPGMNGLTFLERVRNNYDDLPFILFTGKGSEEVASEAISAGATDYLQKEVGTDQYTILANRVVNSVETTRNNRQRQRQLDAIETAQEGISILDKDEHFIYVNEAYADLYRYEPEDMIGKHWELIYPDDDVDFVREEILPSVTEDRDWRGETTGLRADGSTFVEDHTLATTDNGGLICTVRDVTDQQNREQEFKARSTAMETASDGIALLDATGEYTYANEAHADVYGYDDPETFVGESWRMCYSEKELETIEESVMPVLEAQGEWRGELTGKRCDGSTFPQEVTLNVRDGGGMVCVVRDITKRKQREQELHSTSNLLSTLVENIPAGILAEDSARTVRFTNQEFTELFGIDIAPDDLVGSDCAAAERVKNRFVESERFIDSTTEAVADHTSIFHEEFKLVDGRTFERSGTPVQLEEEGTGYLWVYHDITEQKRAENRFRALFENLPDPTVIVELTEDDAITRAVNAAFEDVFGYPAECAVDTSLNELIVPPDAEDESEEIDQKARSGEQLTTEVRRQTANDELRDFLFRNVLIENTEGEPRAHGIYTDITARKRRERRLNVLHEANRDLMLADTRQEVAEIASRAMSDILELPLNGVYLYDADDDGLVPLAASSEARDVIGVPPTFREGESIAWQVFESGEPQIHDDVQKAPTVYNPETPIRSELHLPLGDHGILLIGSTTVDDFDETDISLAKLLASNVAIALDRVERKRELQCQNDRLDEFASVVSHDLRNPLNVAIGHLELAKETGDAEHFEVVAHAQNRMEDIIQDVLTLARQGDTVGETQSIALDTVARRAWANVETGPATLQFDIDRTIDADASRVSQLLENLFRNAIEHGGEGVTVRAGWLEERDGFYIEDTGTGISPKERARVFESGYTTAPDGTGFGLAIVKEIAEAHGWDIDVIEGEDGGARFEFTI
jgi:PAS domain S-box-containing protein